MYITYNLLSTLYSPIALSKFKPHGSLNCADLRLVYLIKFNDSSFHLTATIRGMASGTNNDVLDTQFTPLALRFIPLYVVEREGERAQEKREKTRANLRYYSQVTSLIITFAICVPSHFLFRLITYFRKSMYVRKINRSGRYGKAIAETTQLTLKYLFYAVYLTLTHSLC